MTIFFTLELRTHYYKVNMLPPEEYLIVEKAIRDNIDHTKTIDEITHEIPDIIGPMYYAIYKKEIDKMINDIWNETM